MSFYRVSDLYRDLGILLTDPGVCAVHGGLGEGGAGQRSCQRNSATFPPPKSVSEH